MSRDTKVSSIPSTAVERIRTEFGFHHFFSKSNVCRAKQILHEFTLKVVTVTSYTAKLVSLSLCELLSLLGCLGLLVL